MNLTKDQKEALRIKIEKDGYNFFHDQEVAKGELDTLAKKVEEYFGIKAAKFKKLVKFHYKSSIEEEKAKADEIYEIYKEILG